jgi:restriction endonuclease S subunit
MAEVAVVQKAKLPAGLRIDPEYYRPMHLKMEEMLMATRPKKLKDVASKIISFGAYSLTNQVVYQETGIPFLRCIDIKNGHIDLSNVLFIDAKAHELLHKSEVSPNQVLLTMSGSVGNAAVASTHLPHPVNSNQDIAKITLNRDIDPYYVVVFLNSKYGKFQTLRSTVGSIQQHLFLWQIEELLIPILDIQKEIARMAIQAENALHASLQSFKDAVTMFDNELDVKYASEGTVAIKTLSEVMPAGRMDAEFYQPFYDKIIKSIKKYGSQQFSEVISIKDKNVTPEYGKLYKYIELSNITADGFITDYTLANGEDLPSRARRMVQTNDVLISSVEGSLSSCALVTEEFQDALCSTGFVIDSRKINPETLLVLFKSTPFQHLLKRTCTGTILTAINKTDLQKTEIPIVREAVQKRIAEKVRESYRLRNEAKTLLENATRWVETYIEKISR